jgi:hypothetical protein
VSRRAVEDRNTVFLISHRINLAIARIAHYLSVHPQSGSG